jgi:hypothetical protein
MSASPQSFSKLPRDLGILRELLHSLSQPLTGLRCSLELSLELSLQAPPQTKPPLSIEEAVEQQHESVAVALEETEKVIGMIQLMREYLDAEQPGQEVVSVAFTPVLRNVVEALSSIATVRGVALCLVGSCSASVLVSELQLRLALQYLITAMIEAQPVGGRVAILLGEGPAGAVLRVEGERPGLEATRDLSGASRLTMRKVRLAIAQRVLEGAGASLALRDGVIGRTGFVLRIPRLAAASV